MTMSQSNKNVYKSLYESQRKIIKKLIKTIPKSELTNILAEMKIIKQDYLNGGYQLK